MDLHKLSDLKSENIIQCLNVNEFEFELMYDIDFQCVNFLDQYGNNIWDGADKLDDSYAPDLRAICRVLRTCNDTFIEEVKQLAVNETKVVKLNFTSLKCEVVLSLDVNVKCTRIYIE